jgi:hypothetical protein
VKTCDYHRLVNNNEKQPNSVRIGKIEMKKRAGRTVGMTLFPSRVALRGKLVHVFCRRARW